VPSTPTHRLDALRWWHRRFAGGTGAGCKHGRGWPGERCAASGAEKNAVRRTGVWRPIVARRSATQRPQ
jgi:hypothetical protein